MIHTRRPSSIAAKAGEETRRATRIEIRETCLQVRLRRVSIGHAAENLAQADALIFGRVTYEMMESAWRPPAQTGVRPDWMEPFARTIDAAKKHVVSRTLDRVDWNAELVRGDLEQAVQQLKQAPGKGLLVGGVQLPLALAELGLIDEYEFVVHPRLAGHGPTLVAGLPKRIDLKLVSRLAFGSGAVAMRYEPRR